MKRRISLRAFLLFVLLCPGSTNLWHKTFPNRTEGSVKKHWYKVGASLVEPSTTTNNVQDMHYAEFAEDEVSCSQKSPEATTEISNLYGRARHC